MKANTFSVIAPALGVAALALGIAACVPSSQPPVAETSSPTTAVRTPAPTPAPRPVAAMPPPQYANFLDAPQTPGNWSYGADPDETLAIFTQSGTENTAPFIIRCGVGTGKVSIGRRGASGTSMMRIRTETTERVLTATPISGQSGLVAVELNARDPLLDAMAITKGRFAVEVQGLPTLYVPAWTEVTRVIEDCR